MFRQLAQNLMGSDKAPIPTQNFYFQIQSVQTQTLISMWGIYCMPFLGQAAFSDTRRKELRNAQELILRGWSLVLTGKERVPWAQRAERAWAVPAQVANPQTPGTRVRRLITRTNSFLGAVRSGGGVPQPGWRSAASMTLLPTAALPLLAPPRHVPGAPGA